MKLVTIDLEDHQILRKPSEIIPFPLSPEVKKKIQEMDDFFETLYSPFSKPAGLAGPQVGVGKKIIIAQIPPEAKHIRKDVYDELPPTFFINPSYKPLDEGKVLDWEACYSVPNKMGEVERHFAIQYEAYTLDGEKISRIARGFLARILQHEIGHIEGQLYIDLLTSQSRYGDFEEMMKIRKKEFAEQKGAIKE